MDNVFFEYFDEDDKRWYCGKAPACVALQFQLAMGENFHYLDASMIIEEDE